MQVQKVLDKIRQRMQGDIDILTEVNRSVEKVGSELKKLIELVSHKLYRQLSKTREVFLT